MTKKEFLQLAKERGIKDIRYCGKLKTFFVKGTQEIISAFLVLVNYYNKPFEVATTDKAITYRFKGLKRGYRKEKFD